MINPYPLFKWGKISAILLLLPLWMACQSEVKKETAPITLESLLDELVSVEESARYPAIPYTCRQVSSHDRRSVSPDQPYWFANNDGFGIERTDTVNGRIEKVMFDEKGPGVITRIWITTLDKRGTWRFYFDGNAEPGWILSSYDLMHFGIPELGKGLLLPHTSYEPEGKGGNTLFLPIPYARSCKITFEEALGIKLTPKYYGINFRTYPEGTPIETFSAAVAFRAGRKIAATDSLLQNPRLTHTTQPLQQRQTLKRNESLTIVLPQGENAVYEMTIHIQAKKKSYAQAMRNLILKGEFDGKETIWVPVSDFSGAGMGAFPVKSWFLESDGKGTVISRWLMPYARSGQITLLNGGNIEVNAILSLAVAPLKWDERMLYFHTSWRQEEKVPINNNYDSSDNLDWNFATLLGKGVYKGDVLTLFNHSPKWYGEGDEKIWVDNDTFPSHFGTGTEDYYNSSWAPVYPFHTPFGGAPRADLHSSHAYNTFFRTRNLDGIPFEKQLKFDLEMLSWEKGVVDYATTVYWYGDSMAKAVGTSGMKEATRPLLPTIRKEPGDRKR